MSRVPKPATPAPAATGFDAARERLATLQRQEAAIVADLERRAAVLPGLAEDAEGFRHAVTAKSTEEDRLRALREHLLPMAEAALAAAEAEIEAAQAASAHVAGLRAVREVVAADEVTSAAFVALGEALSASERARRVNEDVIRAAPISRMTRVLDSSGWARFMPDDLRRNLTRIWPIPQGVNYRPDVRAFYSELLDTEL